MSSDPNLKKASESYLDSLFGEGMGARHSNLLDKFASDTLRETLHRYHVQESDTRHVSVEENYLMGMVVLCASKNYNSAKMFAKTLRHLGVAPEKILEAVSRLAMWIGGVPAAESLGEIQRALAEYDHQGLASMDAWFPAPARRNDTSGEETD